MLSKQSITRLRILTMMLCIVVSAVIEVCAVEYNYSLRRNILINDGLYNDEVQDITRDPDGLMWIASRNGLASFDGFSVRNYFQTGEMKGDMPDNNIYCVCADNCHRILFGTHSGFGILDKTTGRFFYPENGKFKGAGVNAILKVSDGKILLGTERGLGIYEEKERKVMPFGDVMECGAGIYGSVKALMEDKIGHVWIGTWSDGIYRWSPREDKVYHYANLNANNSAHDILQDSRGDIWIVAWDIGIQRLIDPYSPAHTTTETFTASGDGLSDKRVYAIGEDKINSTLWIGTREGITLMNLDKPGIFHKLPGRDNLFHKVISETDAIYVDDSGLIWLGSLLSGVALIDPLAMILKKWEVTGNMPDNLVPSVHGLDVDKEGNLWMGLGNYGLARCDTDGSWHFMNEELGFSDPRYVPTVHDVKVVSDGSVWCTLYGEGVARIDAVTNRCQRFQIESSGFVPTEMTTSLFEDSKGNVYVGGAHGFGIRTNGGKVIDASYVASGIVGFFEKKENVYAVTERDGILCVDACLKGGKVDMTKDRLEYPKLPPRFVIV